MKKIITLLTICFIVFSCNSSSGKSKDSAKGMETFSVDEVVASADILSGQEIQVKGMVTHVCKHGGQKMFITDSSKVNNMLVLVTSSIPEFEVSLEGSYVEITGKLVATTTETSGEGHQENELPAEKDDKMGQEACDTANTPGEMEGSEGSVCVTNVTYHIEATSYSELVQK